MFKFENVNILYCLIIIPILIGIYIIVQIYRKKKMAAYCSTALSQKLSVENAPGMRHLKFGLFLAGLACLIIALANPMSGSSLEKGTRKGVDIMICMDISNSMLAEDIQPSRLDASKMALSHFIDKLEGDRIGLVVFAGQAFVQLPITSDYAAAKMFLNIVKPSLISEQGTDIASAIALATKSMLPEQEQDEEQQEQQQIADLSSKVILVVSDGEDHFPEAIETAQEIHELGVTIHTIGIGNTRGEPIPITDKYGNSTYKKDRDGNTVMTRLNEKVLQDIARAGGGTYIHASNTNMGFETILNKINDMEKSDIQEITFKRFDSKFQIPLIIGLLFLFIEILLFTTPSKIKQFFVKLQHQLKGKTALILLGLIIAIPAAQAQSNNESSALQKGNKQLQTAERYHKEAIDLMKGEGEENLYLAEEKQKKAESYYQQAEKYYREALKANPNYDKAQYNLGTSLYRQGKYEEAGEAFESVAKNQNNSKDLRSRAYYNYGNSLLKDENYTQSIEAYKNALKLDPNNMDSKYNLEYAKKKLSQNPDQDKNQKQNQDKQDQQQNNGQGEQDKNRQNQNGSQDQQDKDKQGQSQNGGQDQQNKDKQGKPQNGGQDQQNKDKQGEQQSGQGEQNQNKEQDQQQSAADRQRQLDNKRQLDALQQNERNTQQKVNKQQMQMRYPGSNDKNGNKVPVGSPQEKDW